MEKNGLLSGKMGSVLYLFHYARLYADNSYEEFAIDLIYKIQETFTRETPLEYADGLAGIGSTICYLIRYGFIKADADEILSDIDSLFFQSVYLDKHTNIKRNTGLIGVGFYLLNRIENRFEDTLILLRLKYLLLLVQDIIFAHLRIEGYTYPFSNRKSLSAQEIKDCKRFLRKMLKTGLCPILTNKALSIVEQLAINENDVFAILENFDKDDSTEMIKLYMKQLSESQNESIVKELAKLQLEDISLPPWWELF